MIKRDKINKKIMKITIILAIIGLIGSCASDKAITENQAEITYPSQLVGKWKAVSLFLSDASTGVCHQNKEEKEITFEFKNELSEDKISYTFYGSAPVNSYFGSVTFNGFDEKTKIGKITINTLGGTKMAGSAEMMNCEQNFYNMLNESTGFQLFTDDPNRLHIGKIKEEGGHPRDGGTYFVFEKIK